MDKKEVMERISTLSKLEVTQEEEWRIARGHLHMIQMQINGIESELAATRSVLGEMHRRLLGYEKK